MAEAFVFIDTESNRAKEIYFELGKDLKKNELPRITDIHTLFGEYDLICKIEAEDSNKIGIYVVDRIRSISGVKDTKTFTCIPYKK